MPSIGKGMKQTVILINASGSELTLDSYLVLWTETE